jgi:serine/threonine protein kinase
MDAPVSVHPSDQTVQAYGLGKLDDLLAEAVNKHLADCPACRSRVAVVTSDTFLGRLREAQAQARPAIPPPIGPSLVGLSKLDSAASGLSPPPSSTLPPGLADHPDYEILRELGRGGMGVVYLAENKLMGRKEVLKVVGSHLLERPGVRERFLREIRLAAQLDHPNVVTAFAARQTGDSLIFSMKYLEGYDLAKLVEKNGPLSVPQACNFVYQAALGLQHAHARGMVHRDIKPSNLMLAKDGNKPVIKVLDFGLAKAASEGRTDGGLTQDGQMLGTPHYVAPEQTESPQKADIRADIYSLGCTLYCLLAGHPPFHAESLYELLQAHHSMDAKLLNFVRPEVPVELAALVAKMLAKEPERRFQTPGEVAQALKPFFKLGSAVQPASKLEVSLEERPEALGKTVSNFASTPTQSVPRQPDQVSASRGTVASSQAQRAWDGLIDIGEKQRAAETAPAVDGPKLRKRGAWWSGKWAKIVAAASVVGIAILGVIVFVATDHGYIKIEMNDQDATVRVDEEAIQIDRGVREQTITLRTGPHQVEVVQKGKDSKPTTIVVLRGRTKVVRVEKLDQPATGMGGMKMSLGGGEATKGTPPTSLRSNSTIGQGEIRPLNGKNFEGWSGFYRRESRDPSKIFRIEADEVVWAGQAGRIHTDRSFQNFSFKFEYILPGGSHYGAGAAYGWLKLTSGDPYDIGPANFRVGTVFCALTNGNHDLTNETGDIRLHQYEDASAVVAQRAEDGSRPAGQWNDVDIRCEGREIRFFLNGRQVNRLEANRNIVCHPGLNSVDADIRFRNIRITPLGGGG